MRDDAEVVMIGAGAMGGVIAGALARAGVRLSIIDTDAGHVTAIARDGLIVAGLGGPDGALRVPAMTAPEREGWADLAVVMTPAYETANAAATAARVLKPDGAALSMQNGLGNAETLVGVLGAARVFMGSTRVSADRPAPGRPRATRVDPSAIGELNADPLPRTRWFAEKLSEGGMPTEVSDNVVGVLWSKFIHNCGINALSAITGLRMGEVSRVPGLAQLRWQVIDEALAVAAAKGIRLQYPDPVPELRRHTWRKFTKPSMQQHIEAGQPIEIESLNGWLVREAAALGLDVPANRIVTALARGRALAAMRDKARPDYAALGAEAEAEIARGETPWTRVPEL
jgi:2-dehydropantoate 2-reductase